MQALFTMVSVSVAASVKLIESTQSKLCQLSISIPVVGGTAPWQLVSLVHSWLFENVQEDWLAAWMSLPSLFTLIHNYIENVLLSSLTLVNWWKCFKLSQILMSVQQGTMAALHRQRCVAIHTGHIVACVTLGTSQSTAATQHVKVSYDSNID